MTFVNAITGAIFGGLTRLLAALPDWLVLTVHGALMGIVALVAYAMFSNQASIKRTKSRLMARVLEIRLFQDDPLLVLRAFGRVLTGTAAYMKDSLMPMFVMLPLVVLWIAQLAGWFEWRPLNIGETVVVKAALKPETKVAGQPTSLDAPKGIDIETPAFHSSAGNEVLWRLKASADASGPLVVKVAGDTAEIPIVSGHRLAEVAPRKLGSSSSFWDRLLYPMDKPLAANSVFKEISIEYPERSLMIAGIEVNWLVWLLLVSIILGFVLKKPLGIEF
jgi:uncharacterized membrane protein (DUF106 family)